jgi:hypothetical protein
MLLAHTSGLANFAAFEPDKKIHLHFPPGTHFQYSGEGFNLVQFVIEQKKQRPFLGDTVTPWEWEGYTPKRIQESRKN